MAKDDLDRLPHREPFRFLTEVVELQAGTFGVGVWRVSGMESFFRGHFPGDPLVPGVLLVEAMAQMAGLVAFANGEADPVGPARLSQANVKFKRAVAPPAEIRLEASLTRAMSDFFMFDVRAEASGSIAALGTLILARARDCDGPRGGTR